MKALKASILQLQDRLDHMAPASGDKKGQAVSARRKLLAALGTKEPAPEFMLGSLASVPLPDARSPAGSWHPLQRALLEKHRIEVPVFVFPSFPRQLVRVAAQVYNSEEQFDRLASALRAELA